MKRNQIGESVGTNSHQEQVFQIRLPNYQNIMNQLDQARSSNIQLQHVYKNFHIQ